MRRGRTSCGQSRGRTRPGRRKKSPSPALSLVPNIIRGHPIKAGSPTSRDRPPREYQPCRRRVKKKVGFGAGPLAAERHMAMETRALPADAGGDDADKCFDIRSLDVLAWGSCGVSIVRLDENDIALPVQILRHAKAALRTEVALDSKGREMSWARGREERPNTGRRRIRRDHAPIAPH